MGGGSGGGGDDGVEEGFDKGAETGAAASSKVMRVGGPGAWYQHVALFGFVLGSGALVLAVLSVLPKCQGDAVFHFLSGYYAYAFKLLGLSSAVALALLVLDVHNWRGSGWRVVAYTLLLAAYLGFGAGSMLAIREYVVAPIGLFFVSAPFTLVIFKALLMPRMDVVSFLATTSAALLLVFAGSLAAWVSWIMLAGKWWTVPTKLELYERFNCSVNETALLAAIGHTDLGAHNLTSGNRAAVDSVLSGCTPAFMEWIVPLLLALWCLVFALVLLLLIVSILRVRAPGRHGKGGSLASSLLILILLGVLGAWSAAGIAGNSMHLTGVVLILAALGLVSMGLVAVAVLGSGMVQQGVATTPLGDRMIKSLTSDWMKAFLLMGIAPLFAAYLVLAFLQQCSRKTLSCAKPLSDEERAFVFSARATRYLRLVARWNWTSVLVKVIWIGFWVFMLFVGALRITVVFLSWLNQQLLAAGPAVTILVFLAVGLLIFSNPFTGHGVPVYFAGGILVTNTLSEPLGFWPAVGVVCLICWGLKMFSIPLLQIGEGEWYGANRVWVRQLVGVNSLEIRAIRSVLLKPGLSFDKVCILCGGPDWPTNVLCGILRLSLCEMMIASSPILIILAPVAVAGALVLRAHEDAFWASVSVVALGVATASQSIAVALAVHYIAKEAVLKEDELRALPPDEEVLAREKEGHARRKLRAEISHWKNQGCLSRSLLAFNALLMTLSIYAFELFGSVCFVPYEVNDTIEEALGGNALNLVKPAGWYAMLVFLVPNIYLFIFNKYVDSKATRARNDPNAIVAVGPVDDGDAKPDDNDDDDDDRSPSQKRKDQERHSVSMNIGARLLLGGNVPDSL
jgi:hypothetical protein